MLNVGIVMLTVTLCRILVRWQSGSRDENRAIHADH